METKPRLMPLLPLRGMLVFPGMIINLDVGRERSIHAVEAAMTSDKQILLVSQKDHYQSGLLCPASSAKRFLFLSGYNCTAQFAFSHLHFVMGFIASYSS